MKPISEYYPPFIVIPFGIDINGKGPANEEDTVKTVFQVWDGNNETISEHESEIEAVLMRNGYDYEWRKLNERCC